MAVKVSAAVDTYVIVWILSHLLVLWWFRKGHPVGYGGWVINSHIWKPKIIKWAAAKPPFTFINLSANDAIVIQFRQPILNAYPLHHSVPLIRLVFCCSNAWSA